VAQLCNRYITSRAQCQCLRAAVCECASCRWQLRAGKIAHSTSYSTSKQDHCMLHAQVPLHTHTHALAHPVSSPKLYLILCVWVCMRVLGSQQIKSRGPFTTHTHTHTHTRTHTYTYTYTHTHTRIPPSLRQLAAESLAPVADCVPLLLLLLTMSRKLTHTSHGRWVE
jgi:hypothetical protein